MFEFGFQSPTAATIGTLGLGGDPWLHAAGILSQAIGRNLRDTGTIFREGYDDWLRANGGMMATQDTGNFDWGTTIGGVAGAIGSLLGGSGGGSKKKKASNAGGGKIADQILKRAFGGTRNAAAQELAGSFLRDRLPLSTGEMGGLGVYSSLLAPQLGDTVSRLFAARDSLSPQLQQIASGNMLMPDVDPYVKLAMRTYQNMVAPQLAGQFAGDNAFFSDLYGNTSRRAAQDMSTELAAKALDLAPQNTQLALQGMSQLPGFITSPIGQGTGAVGSIFQTGLTGRTLLEGTRTGAQPLVGSIFDPGGGFQGLSNTPRLYSTPESAGSGWGGIVSALGGLAMNALGGNNNSGSASSLSDLTQAFRYT